MKMQGRTNFYGKFMRKFIIEIIAIDIKLILRFIVETNGFKYEKAMIIYGFI